MSIIACSNEVSFKSAAVDNVLLKVPAIVGCEVLKRVTPSPELKDPDGQPLFNGAAALTCLV